MVRILSHHPGPRPRRESGAQLKGILAARGIGRHSREGRSAGRGSHLPLRHPLGEPAVPAPLRQEPSLTASHPSQTKAGRRRLPHAPRLTSRGQRGAHDGKARPLLPHLSLRPGHNSRPPRPRREGDLLTLLTRSRGHGEAAGPPLLACTPRAPQGSPPLERKRNQCFPRTEDPGGEKIRRAFTHKRGKHRPVC